MRYLLVLEDSTEICSKKKIKRKPTKELVDRFCDFCNKSKAFTIGVFCEEPEIYYNFIETIVMQCKKLFDPHRKAFSWFFTKDIMTEELVRKLEDLQERMLKSREDFSELEILDGYLWCWFLRESETMGEYFVQRLRKSKLKFGLMPYSDTTKDKCSFMFEAPHLSNAYRFTSDAPLLVYEDLTCVVYPDGSIRFADDFQEYYSRYIEIGNIWTDDCLSDAVIKQRLEEFGAFLKENNLLYHNREFFCENVCSRFRVTKQGIYCDDQLMKEVSL